MFNNILFDLPFNLWQVMLFIFLNKSFDIIHMFRESRMMSRWRSGETAEKSWIGVGRGRE